MKVIIKGRSSELNKEVIRDKRHLLATVLKFPMIFLIFMIVRTYFINKMKLTGDSLLI